MFYASEATSSTYVLGNLGSRQGRSGGHRANRRPARWTLPLYRDVQDGRLRQFRGREQSRMVAGRIEISLVGCPGFRFYKFTFPNQLVLLSSTREMLLSPRCPCQLQLRCVFMICQNGFGLRSAMIVDYLGGACPYKQLVSYINLLVGFPHHQWQPLASLDLVLKNQFIFGNRICIKGLSIGSP